MTNAIWPSVRQRVLMAERYARKLPFGREGDDRRFSWLSSLVGDERCLAPTHHATTELVVPGSMPAIFSLSAMVKSKFKTSTSPIGVFCLQRPRRWRHVQASDVVYRRRRSYRQGENMEARVFGHTKRQLPVNGAKAPGMPRMTTAARRSTLCAGYRAGHYSHRYGGDVRRGQSRRDGRRSDCGEAR